MKVNEMRKTINTTSRKLDDEFYDTFSKLYNSFYSFGLIPKEISKVMCLLYKVSESSYYRYLRIVRQKGLVETTYKEMQYRKNKRLSNEIRENTDLNIQALINELSK